MRQPYVFIPQNLLENVSADMSVRKSHPEDVSWAPNRPRYRLFEHNIPWYQRFQCAWRVFTGRYDVLDWAPDSLVDRMVVHSYDGITHRHGFLSQPLTVLLNKLLATRGLPLITTENTTEGESYSYVGRNAEKGTVVVIIRHSAWVNAIKSMVPDLEGLDRHVQLVGKMHLEKEYVEVFGYINPLLTLWEDPVGKHLNFFQHVRITNDTNPERRLQLPKVSDY